MKIADLGQLEGELLLFGGPYSNLEATRAVLAQARTSGAAHIFCTGDVAAYCADPAATVQEIRQSGAHVICGNCEVQLASGAEDCGCGFAQGSACDLLSARWYPFAKQALDAGALAWMAGLPDWIVFTHAGRRYAMVHGAASDAARFVWSVTPEAELAAEIARIEAEAGRIDAVIAGHSGIAFAKTVGRHQWINAGVIGMPPHDGHAQTEYARLSPRGDLSFHRLAYDAPAAAAAMRAKGLPEGYALALTTGIWPSEDVLPAPLRRAQSLASG